MKRRAETRVERGARGRAIELWLAERFTYLDEAAWRSMLREGRLAVNGKIASEGLILEAKDLVVFDAPPREEPAVDESYSVLYEDGDYLVVDKPPLLPCHPGGAFFEHSLTRLLARHYGPVRIATRLDRETSGLVLACKSAEAAAAAQKLRATGRLAKGYLALVHGVFPESVEAIGYLTRDAESAVRKKRKYFAGPPPTGTIDAEPCATHFRLERIVGAYSLVSIDAATGRTHQIRATLLALGFPILGDKLYGLDEGCYIRFSEGRLSEADEERLVLPYQALHCRRLAFEDRRGARVELEAPPPWGLDARGVWTTAKALA